MGGILNCQNDLGQEEEILISVIVAVHNVEKYITKCIESIINQTYHELEIILIDDGSTDESGSICDRFILMDSRIHVIHKEQGGPGSARNAGLDYSKGELIAFVDGDDWIDKNMLSSMLEIMNRYDADVVACRYRSVFDNKIIDESTDDRYVYNQPLDMLIQILKEDESVLIQQAVWNKLYKRQLLQEIRFAENTWYEDVMFTTKVFTRVIKGVYVNSAYYNYVRTRADSIMNSNIINKTFSELIPIMKQKEEYLLALGNPLPVMYHRFNFYKKLLLLYVDLVEKQDPKLKGYKKEIKNLLNQRKETFHDVYHLDIAKQSDNLRMKLFMMSPYLYYLVDKLNRRIILPVRLRRRKK